MNSTIKPRMMKLVNLMSSGELDKARDYVEVELVGEVEAMRATLNEVEAELQVMRTFLNSSLNKPSIAPPLPLRPYPNPQTLIEGTEPNVRNQLLALAAEIARANNGMVELDQVVKAAHDRGVQLSSTRPGTTIANILFKANNLWSREGPGLFKLLM